MKRNSQRSIGRVKMLLILLCALTVPFLLYYGIRYYEMRSVEMYGHEDYTRLYITEPVMEVDGKSYCRRSGLTTILLMGIDKDSSASGGSLQGGQADFLRLIVIDDKNQTVSQLQIDRDTITPITTLNVFGQRGGMRNAQISLSHGFGDGGHQSAELTVEAVSNFLFGMEIDFYISMNLDGIAVLNDWAGGVTVTLEDDFSEIDPAMTKGATLTLMGDQAETYVRRRMQIGSGTNEARMQRQQTYISQLLTLAAEKISNDQSALDTLITDLEPYLTMNITRGRIVNELWAAQEYRRTPLIKIAGEHYVGTDGFMEFIADKEQLTQLVLDLFCEEMES